MIMVDITCAGGAVIKENALRHFLANNAPVDFFARFASSTYFSEMTPDGMTISYFVPYDALLREAKKLGYTEE